MYVHLISPKLNQLNCFVSFVSADWYQSCTNIYRHLQWSHILSVILFIWASIHQFKCHVILANLCSTAKQTTTSSKVYKIPYGDWFQFVSSPHYLAEILIYISFVVMQKGANVYLWLMLLFVVQNLSLGATVTHSWYHDKFKEYPKSRTRLIPFIYWNFRHFRIIYSYQWSIVHSNILTVKFQMTMRLFYFIFVVYIRYFWKFPYQAKWING